MSIRGTFGLLACLIVAGGPRPAAAQTATGVIAVPPATGNGLPSPRHEYEVAVAYDSLTDSTHLAVVTHKGKYFLWIQKPRLTWTTAYAGRTPAAEPPLVVVLEFRTQAPQAARDSRLVLQPASGDPIEVVSAGGYGEQGPITSNHYMRFIIPAADLAAVLAGQSFRLSVGGIRVSFKSTEIYALRALLQQAGELAPADPS
ncbi:MAG TPA: hypothetical protein VIM84_04595, partial [Gemmatimonadales bacterium]